MKKGLVLQERDVELLEFLAQYKTITLIILNIFMVLKLIKKKGYVA